MVTKFIMYTNPSGKIIFVFSVRIRPSLPTYMHVTIHTHVFPHISTPPPRPLSPRARLLLYPVLESFRNQKEEDRIGVFWPIRVDHTML